MDEQNHEVTTRPEPQVNKEKQYFADASVDIPNLCQTVLKIEDRISLEEQAVNRTQDVIDTLEREKSGLYFEYLNNCGSLLKSLTPHLALEDRENSRKLREEIFNTADVRLYNKERITNISDFITSALFNANLSALGPKTRILEIINEIDISKI
jgi:hypothetical protein